MLSGSYIQTDDSEKLRILATIDMINNQNNTLSLALNQQYKKLVTRYPNPKAYVIPFTIIRTHLQRYSQSRSTYLHGAFGQSVSDIIQDVEDSSKFLDSCFIYLENHLKYLNLRALYDSLISYQKLSSRVIQCLISFLRTQVLTKNLNQREVSAKICKTSEEQYFIIQKDSVKASIYCKNCGDDIRLNKLDILLQNIARSNYNPLQEESDTPPEPKSVEFKNKFGLLRKQTLIKEPEDERLAELSKTINSFLNNSNRDLRFKACQSSEVESFLGDWMRELDQNITNHLQNLKVIEKQNCRKLSGCYLQSNDPQEFLTELLERISRVFKITLREHLLPEVKKVGLEFINLQKNAHKKKYCETEAQTEEYGASKNIGYEAKIESQTIKISEIEELNNQLMRELRQMRRECNGLKDRISIMTEGFRKKENSFNNTIMKLNEKISIMRNNMNRQSTFEKRSGSEVSLEEAPNHGNPRTKKSSSKLQRLEGGGVGTSVDREPHERQGSKKKISKSRDSRFSSVVKLQKGSSRYPEVQSQGKLHNQNAARRSKSKRYNQLASTAIKEEDLEQLKILANEQGSHKSIGARVKNNVVIVSSNKNQSLLNVADVYYEKLQDTTVTSQLNNKKERRSHPSLHIPRIQRQNTNVHQPSVDIKTRIQSLKIPDEQESKEPPQQLAPRFSKALATKLLKHCQQEATTIENKQQDPFKKEDLLKKGKQSVRFLKKISGSKTSQNTAFTTPQVSQLHTGGTSIHIPFNRLKRPLGEVQPAGASDDLNLTTKFCFKGKQILFKAKLQEESQQFYSRVQDVHYPKNTLFSIHDLNLFHGQSEAYNHQRQFLRLHKKWRKLKIVQGPSVDSLPHIARQFIDYLGKLAHSNHHLHTNIIWFVTRPVSTLLPSSSQLDAHSLDVSLNLLTHVIGSIFQYHNRCVGDSKICSHLSTFFYKTDFYNITRKI